MGTPKSKYAARFAEGYPSGQREQTVNLPAYAFEGSNPSLSTSIMMSSNGECGNSSVGRARAFQARGRGFESRFPLFSVNLNRAARLSRGVLSIVRTDAHVAQSVEHFLGKEEVTGSNPVVGFPELRVGIALLKKFFEAYYNERSDFAF